MYSLGPTKVRLCQPQIVIAQLGCSVCLFVCFQASTPEGKLSKTAEELYYAKLDKRVNRQDLTSRLVSHRIG